MRLAHLAIIAPLFSAPALAEDCRPAADEFLRVASIAVGVVDLVDAHRVDWENLEVSSEAQQHAYTEVKLALDDLLPTLDSWVEAAETANVLALRCKLEGELTTTQVLRIERAVFAAVQMVAAVRPYLEAYNVATAR